MISRFRSFSVRPRRAAEDLEVPPSSPARAGAARRGGDQPHIKEALCPGRGHEDVVGLIRVPARSGFLSPFAVACFGSYAPVSRQASINTGFRAKCPCSGRADEITLLSTDAEQYAAPAAVVVYGLLLPFAIPSLDASPLQHPPVVVQRLVLIERMSRSRAALGVSCGRTLHFLNGI